MAAAVQWPAQSVEWLSVIGTGSSASRMRNIAATYLVEADSLELVESAPSLVHGEGVLVVKRVLVLLLAPK